MAGADQMPPTAVVVQRRRKIHPVPAGSSLFGDAFDGLASKCGGVARPGTAKIPGILPTAAAAAVF
jgi:hypothetical protein